MAYLLVYLFVALPTGVLFLWVALLPDTLPAVLVFETIPVLVRGFAGVCGSVLTTASLMALRHGLRLQWIVRRHEPTPARVWILVDDSCDMTTYTATVSFMGSDATWQTPIYYNRAVDRLLDRSARRVEAWRDFSDDTPIALRVDGRLVVTYPKAGRLYPIARS